MSGRYSTKLDVDQPLSGQHRRPSALHLADDATIQHLRPGPDAAGTQSASATPEGIDQHLRPASRPIRDAGDADADPPALTLEQTQDGE